MKLYSNVIFSVFRVSAIRVMIRHSASALNRGEYAEWQIMTNDTNAKNTEDDLCTSDSVLLVKNSILTIHNTYYFPY